MSGSLPVFGKSVAKDRDYSANITLYHLIYKFTLSGSSGDRMKKASAPWGQTLLSVLSMGILRSRVTRGRG